MMNTLYQLEGSQFRIEVLQTEKVQQFIGKHAEILDSSFQQVKMSDTMRQRLQRSDYIFSGIKTFHELNEAFPSLINPDGTRKPFEQFLNDVRKIDKTYNQHYLRAEYNLAQQSATMAAKWEQYLEDGDRYNLQYRTANDGRVRPEHAALNRVTLPITDPFWETYYPPNGWNCRCTVVQVRKGKYPETNHDDAMHLGEEATGNDKRGIFHFNPGKEQKTFPDYNPYTIRRCRDCDIAKGKLSLTRPIVPENDLCEACRILRKQQKAVKKAEQKELKLQLRKSVQGSILTNEKFGHEILVSRASIDEWVNQPFKYMEEKAQMLFNIKDIISKAEYLGPADKHKDIDRLIQSHIFKTKVRDLEAYIIVQEFKGNLFILHSISDSPNILKYLKKK